MKTLLTLNSLDRSPVGAGSLGLAVEHLDPTGAVVAVAGELDMATAPRLREQLNALIAAGARRLVVDLRGVSFMDSIALAALVRAQQRLGDKGRMAVVIERESYAFLIFEAAGLPHCLELAETLPAAIARVGG
jgi:anti-sigma B factor antagonist